MKKREKPGLGRALIRAHAAWLAIILTSTSLFTATSVQASQNWEKLDGQAIANLPLATESDLIGSAALACSGQEWKLTILKKEDWRDQLRGAETAQEQAHEQVRDLHQAQLRIGKLKENIRIRPDDLFHQIAISKSVLAAMATGSSLQVRLGEGEGAIDGRFSLRGSKLVIDQMRTECSPRRIEGYEVIGFEAAAPEIETARQLLEGDIASFRLATFSEPRLEARMLAVGRDKSLLVARLCGSSWYFGRTGCHVSGFTKERASEALEDWKPGFEMEGSILYRDQKSAAEDWPGLLSIKLRDEGEGDLWRWAGGHYQLQDADVSFEGVAAID